MLVISPWGNPRFWKKVKYVRDEVSEKDPKKVKEILENLKVEAYSYTPLSLFESWRKLVVVPASIADGKGNVNDLALDKMREIVKSKDEEFLKIFEEADKVVVPSTGVYKSNEVLKEFDVPFSNVYSGIILKLYEKLREANEETILLDITHGVNYYPVTIREALDNYILKLISIDMRKKIKYAIGASDPIVGSGEELRDVELRYHVFQVKEIEPNLQELSEFVKDLNNIDKGKCEAYLQNRGTLSELANEMVKLEVPSPLYWAYVMDKVIRNKEKFEEAVGDLLMVASNALEHYEVEGERVRQDVVFDEKGIINLIAMRTFLDIVKERGEIEGNLYLVNRESLEELEGYLRGVDEKLWNEENSKLTESLKELKKINLDNLRERIAEIAKGYPSGCESIEEDLRRKLNKVEAEKVREGLEELLKLTQKAIPYSLLKHAKKELQDSVLWWAYHYAKEAEEADARNFIAHAGMEMNATVITLDGERIGYYIPMLEKIEEPLLKALKH
ncbi:hypothetical protein IPA_07890 [Ignicoccus pacificus DSM 13166]|uniref:CRISPR-associated protein, MJ1666 family n=1 Tax=Ignicoccus pacificus DSM 13166 TaxID=940294 RepID=A0A977KBS0_9CREN|nr:hypothetical protein IPA_07890 [Ignicoccus pacificus DSM 13166]